MTAKVEAAGALASHEAFKDGQTSLAALQAQQQPPPPFQPLHHQQLVYQQPQTMYQPHQPQLLQQQMQMPLTPTGGHIKSAASRAFGACRGEHRGSV